MKSSIKIDFSERNLFKTCCVLIYDSFQREWFSIRDLESASYQTTVYLKRLEEAGLLYRETRKQEHFFRAFTYGGVRELWRLTDKGKDLAFYTADAALKRHWLKEVLRGRSSIG